MKTCFLMVVLLFMLSACSLLAPEIEEPVLVDGVDYYGDYYKDYYRRPVQISGAIATMPSEDQGPICGTTGVTYCRNVVGLFKVPYETDIVSIRWEFDGRQIPEGNDLHTFTFNFGSTGWHNAKITVVDEFDRTVVFDGPFRVVNPKSDYRNTWYRY